MLKLRAARLRLLRNRPFLAAAVWRMPIVEQLGLGTMAVSQSWQLYVDPTVVEVWSVEELEGVLYHEVCHLLRDHPRRMKALFEEDQERTNIAADLEINDDLVREGVKLPCGALRPEQFGLQPGLLAEEYFERLKGAQQLRTAGQGQGGPKAPQKHGSGAHGHRQPWEDGCAEGPSSLEQEAIRRAVAEAARRCSTAPGHWREWAEVVLQPPKVPWERELRGAVRRFYGLGADADEATYARPSRRRLPNVVLPGREHAAPHVAVVLDSSGSVGAAEWNRALSELGGILRTLDCPVEVYVVDTEVQWHGWVDGGRVQDVPLEGRGGTDMSRGLAEAEAARPAVIVVVTDGLTPWPDRKPKARVVVVLTGPGSAPSWARTIRVEV